MQNVFRTFWNISAVYTRHVLSMFHANIPEVQQKFVFAKDCLCKTFSERFGIIQPYIPGRFSAYSIKNFPKQDRLQRFSFPAETLWNVSGTFREQCSRSVPKCSACQLSCPIRFERSKSRQSTCRVGFWNVPGTFQNCFRYVLKMVLLGYNSRTKNVPKFDQIVYWVEYKPRYAHQNFWMLFWFLSTSQHIFTSYNNL